MKKHLITYRKKIDELILEGDCDWETLKKEHLVQISFFQHERLIHLIVTSLFAILEGMSVVMMIIDPNKMTGIFSIAIVLLLIPYVLHYFTLENEVQKLYIQYDKMQEASQYDSCKIRVE